jgi:hypothetical protein
LLGIQASALLPKFKVHGILGIHEVTHSLWY